MSGTKFAGGFSSDDNRNLGLNIWQFYFSLGEVGNCPEQLFW